MGIQGGAALVGGIKVVLGNCETSKHCRKSVEEFPGRAVLPIAEKVCPDSRFVQTEPDEKVYPAFSLNPRNSIAWCGSI